MGHPQAYGVIHYLEDFLLDDYSYPVKKLHHKTISHLFFRVVYIRGHKDNICAAKKTPNKIWCKVSRECIKFPTFTKYQMTQKRIILRLKQMLKTIKDKICQKKQQQFGEIFCPP
jgi:hypothetical protein